MNLVRGSTSMRNAPVTVPTLSVMLIVSDATAAVAWYCDALGAERLWDLGGVAALQLQGAPFLLHEAVPGKVREKYIILLFLS